MLITSCQSPSSSMLPQSHPQTLLCRTAAASSRYPQLQQQVSSSRPATQRHVHTTTESYAAEDGQLATTRRQTLLLAAAVPAFIPQPAAAASKPAYSPAFLRAFEQALSIKGSWQDQDRAWSEVVRLGPDNAAAWSNRGTLRLQNQQWAAAYEDLQQAVALEQQQTGSVSAVVLNNLGNVEGALGRWQDAMQHYQQAAEDPEMGSIAGANYALAAWETGQDDAAIKAARSLLRRDSEFLDMRCALTAFLWGSGRRSEAEDSWEQLQEAVLGSALYSRGSAVERVRHRWPPRATAALVAFLTLSDEGQAEGYDLVQHKYRFAATAAA